MQRFGYFLNLVFRSKVTIVTPDFPQRAYWDNSPVVGALIFLNTGVTFYVTDTVEDVRVKCSEEVF